MSRIHSVRHKDQQQAGNKAVNTGGLGNGAAQQHGAGHIAFAFGLTADGGQRLAHGVTFADTRADACDQGETCANGAASQYDCTFHKFILLLVFSC